MSSKRIPREISAGIRRKRTTGDRNLKKEKILLMRKQKIINYKLINLIT